MEDKVIYPATALVYLGLVSWESRGHNLELGTAAAINVFCLFVFAQPLCLVIGGYQGVCIYLCMALLSYGALPRKRRPTQGNLEDSTQTTEKKQTKQTPDMAKQKGSEGKKINLKQGTDRKRQKLQRRKGMD